MFFSPWARPDFVFITLRVVHGIAFGLIGMLGVNVRRRVTVGYAGVLATSTYYL